MKVNYDPQMDALYIDLCSGKYDITKKITDSILVDITKEGKILGIEILDASENIGHFDPQQFNISLQFKNLTSRQI
ncbi:DUF2283 domain-containing protein [Candidatus Gottesmanbacteria bacterium]|nr:DUF2283 domain-containing protein [Candidatus Gottesmanbacteria bacterium]